MSSQRRSWDLDEIPANMRIYFEEFETICGKGWERVVEKDYEPAHSRGTEYRKVEGTTSRTSGKAWKDGGWNELPALRTANTTLGWRPGCTCYGKPEIGMIECQKCRGTGRERATHVGKTQTTYPQGSTAGRLALLRQAAREAGDEYDASFQGLETGESCPACEGMGQVEGELWPDMTGWPTVPCIVLDPFVGSGTSVMVALRLGRRAIGIDLSEDYVRLARQRIIEDAPLFNAANEKEMYG